MITTQSSPANSREVMSPQWPHGAVRLHPPTRITTFTTTLFRGHLCLSFQDYRLISTQLSIDSGTRSLKVCLTPFIRVWFRNLELTSFRSKLQIYISTSFSTSHAHTTHTMPRGSEYADAPAQSDNAIDAGENKAHGVGVSIPRPRYLFPSRITNYIR